MKANVPEKIYIEVTPDGTRYYRDVFKEQRTENSDIEYTRTDTFIEEAENYLRNKCQRFILTNKDIEDFVNYMKGE